MQRQSVVYGGSNATKFHEIVTQQSKNDDVCAVMWLTGRLFDDYVIGYAWVKGACSQCGAPIVGFAASERVIDEDDGFLSAVNLEAWIVGHELGHLLGANHVGSSNYLMSPTINNRNPSVEPFSLHPNTQKDIQTYLKSCQQDQCLSAPSKQLPHLDQYYHTHHRYGTSHDAYWAFLVLIPFAILLVVIVWW